MRCGAVLPHPPPGRGGSKRMLMLRTFYQSYHVWRRLGRSRRGALWICAKLYVLCSLFEVYRKLCRSRLLAGSRGRISGAGSPVPRSDGGALGFSETGRASETQDPASARSASINRLGSNER
jgi:hypothetical protein